MKNLRSVSKQKIIRMIRQMETAIKKNCYDCMAGQKRLDCKDKKCNLYSYRPWVEVAVKSDSNKNNQFRSLIKKNKAI